MRRHTRPTTKTTKLTASWNQDMPIAKKHGRRSDKSKCDAVPAGWQPKGFKPWKPLSNDIVLKNEKPTEFTEEEKKVLEAIGLELNRKHSKPWKPSRE
jgi:hypothetical protein